MGGGQDKKNYESVVADKKGWTPVVIGNPINYSQGKAEPSELLDMRDEFAIRILPILMSRYKDPGYGDTAAIVEAYSLAGTMIEVRNNVSN